MSDGQAGAESDLELVVWGFTAKSRAQASRNQAAARRASQSQRSTERRGCTMEF